MSYSEKFTLAERLEAAHRDRGITPPETEQQADLEPLTESEDDAQ